MNLAREAKLKLAEERKRLAEQASAQSKVRRCNENRYSNILNNDHHLSVISTMYNRLLHLW